MTPKGWMRALAIPLLLAAAWQWLSSDPARAYVFVPLTSVARSAVELVLDGELFSERGREPQEDVARAVPGRRRRAPGGLGAR